MAISANELRINNYCLHEGKMHKIIAYDILMASRGDTYEPILLTPEILEKCGFKSYSKDIYKLMSYEWYTDGGLYMEYDSTVTGSTTIHLDHIKYLHQLQNHHYFHYGEELEINLH